MSSNVNNGSEASIETILNSIRQTAAQDQFGEAQGTEASGENTENHGAAPAPEDGAGTHRPLSEALASAQTPNAEAKTGTGRAPDWNKPHLVLSSLSDLASEAAAGGRGQGSDAGAAAEGQVNPEQAETSSVSAQDIGSHVAKFDPGVDAPRVMAAFCDTRMNRLNSSETPAPASSAVPKPQPSPAPAAAPNPVPPPLAAAPAAPTAPAPQPMMDSPPPQQALADAAASASAHDAAAELLRPVLRQWVGENMPRIVEKALHIELAESIKNPAGQNDKG